MSMCAALLLTGLSFPTHSHCSTLFDRIFCFCGFVVLLREYFLLTTFVSVYAVMHVNERYGYLLITVEWYLSCTKFSNCLLFWTILLWNFIPYTFVTCLSSGLWGKGAVMLIAVIGPLKHWLCFEVGIFVKLCFLMH